MANISLKRLFEAEDFKAKSKETGKLVHFKSKDSYQAALKAGTHEDPNAKKGEQPKVDAKPNDMFGGDYSKDRGDKTPTSNTTHVSVLPDSQEVKTISKFTSTREKFIADFINKHKLDASALSKFIEKGSLRDRMDVGTAMVGNPGNEYEKDLIKKFGTSKSDVTKVGKEEPNTSSKLTSMLPKKASKLNYKHAEVLEKAVNAETGLKGYVDTDDNTDAIMYNASSGVYPTYTLYFGGNDDYGKPDEFRVSLAPTYGNDPANLGYDIDKTFQNGDEAMKFMIAVAKKYKKELEMDDEDTNESTKLTTMIKK